MKFGWLKPPVFRSDPPSGEVRYRIGSHGKYRWFLYEHESSNPDPKRPPIALCNVTGYASKKEAQMAFARAVAAARKVVEK